MTQCVDDRSSPPVDRAISRRRFLQMGALAVAAGLAPHLADARTTAPKTVKPSRPSAAPAQAPASATARSASASVKSGSHGHIQAKTVPATPRPEPIPHVVRAKPGSPAVSTRRGVRPVSHATSTHTAPAAEAPRLMPEPEPMPLARPAAPTPIIEPSVRHAKFERALHFYNTHTGESLRTVYWFKGQYVQQALRDINRVLRDHHNDEIKAIDPDLLDLLYAIGQEVELRQAFHVLSAYRSPATNAMLRMYNRGVAEHSMHIEGKAVDIRLPGRSLGLIYRAAIDLQGGGVGYYPESGFVHVDSGPVRAW